MVGKSDAISNNVAEYAGVLHVLKYLASRLPGRVKIHGDSNLLINQLNGKWRINKDLYFQIAIETRELLADLREHGWQINLRWIPRDQNEECDALSHTDPIGRSKEAGGIRNYASDEHKVTPKEHRHSAHDAKSSLPILSVIRACH
jgi:ribonuclease HI